MTDDRRRPRRARIDRSPELGERDRAICRRIAEARVAANLSQREMAEILDVGARTYQSFEDSRVPWRILDTISRLTGRPLEWLIRGDEALVTPERSILVEEIERRLVPRLDAIDERLGRLVDRV